MEILNNIYMLYTYGNIISLFILICTIMLSVSLICSVCIGIYLTIKKPFIIALAMTLPFITTFSFMAVLTYYLVQAEIAIVKTYKQKEDDKIKTEQLDKMCFVLDTTIKIHKDTKTLEESSIAQLNSLTEAHFNEMLEIKDEYLNKNTPAGEFNENTNLSELYSLGYDSILNTLNEVKNRRIYCFKNYCNKSYYDELYEKHIQDTLKKYLALNCDEMLRKEGI